MNQTRRSPTPGRIEDTVRFICGFIQADLSASSKREWSEFELRKELVLCILSSRVHFQSALHAMENLEHAGLLGDDCWYTARTSFWRSKVQRVLSGVGANLPHAGAHRFFRVRSDQLARTRDALVRESLTELVSIVAEPRRVRECLVAQISGLGPKQASLFLRNVGRSYDLAVLDSHVINFMEMQKLVRAGDVRTNTISDYERVEEVLLAYADLVGFPAGYLDWAIWATMKAVREVWA